MTLSYKYIGLPVFLILCLYAFQRNYESNLWEHLAHRAEVNWLKGDKEKAKRLISSSLRLAEKQPSNDSRYFKVFYLAGLIDMSIPEPGMAELYLKKALLVLENNPGMKQKYGSRMDCALGMEAYRAGNFEMANTYWQRAKSDLEHEKDVASLAWVCYHLSLVKLKRLNHVEAAALLHRAEELVAELPELTTDIKIMISSVKHALAMQYLETNPVLSRQKMAEAIQYDFNTFSTESHLFARTYFHGALQALKSGDMEGAVHQLNQAASILEKHNVNMQELKKIYTIFADLYENKEKFFLASQYRQLLEQLQGSQTKMP